MEDEGRASKTVVSNNSKIDHQQSNLQTVDSTSYFNPLNCDNDKPANFFSSMAKLSTNLNICLVRCRPNNDKCLSDLQSTRESQPTRTKSTVMHIEEKTSGSNAELDAYSHSPDARTKSNLDGIISLHDDKGLSNGNTCLDMLHNGCDDV